MPKRGQFAFAFALALACLAPAAGAQVSDQWRFARDPASGLGSSDAVSAAGSKLAFRCYANGRGGDAAPPPGVATLYVAPRTADSTLTTARPFGFEVDGRTVVTVPMRFDAAAGALAASVLLDSPLLPALARGGSLQIYDWRGERRPVGLSGSGAALEALRSHCAPSRQDAERVPRPGFACDRAATATEAAICTDPELARLDAEMSAAFAAARSRGWVDAQGVARQRAWIARREGCDGSFACIAAQTRVRVAELSRPTVTAGGDAPLPQFGVAQGTPSLPGFSGPALGEAQRATVGARPAAEAGAGAVVGNEAVARHLSLWVIGQRPALVRDLGVQQQMRTGGLPEGFPAFQGVLSDAAALDAYLESVAARAGQLTFPDRIVVDVGASIVRAREDMPFTLRLSGGAATIANHGLQESSPMALRTLHVQSPYRTGLFELAEGRPLPLPLPAEIAGASPPERGAFMQHQLFPGSAVFVRFTIELGGPQVELPQSVERVGIGMTSAATAPMSVVEAALIRQEHARSNEPPKPEVVLHRWSRADGADALASVGDMADPSVVAGRYSMGVSGDRLVHALGEVREAFGLPPDGVMGTPDAAARSAALAMRIDALLRAAPERTLAPELAAKAAFEILTPLERDSVLPVGFAPTPSAAGMNELEWRQAIGRAEPEIRRMVRERAPALPVEVTAITAGMLDQYRGGGFPVRYDAQGLEWLPVPPTSGGLSSELRDAASFVEMSEQEAIALLDRIERRTGGRGIYVALDYTLGAISIRAVRSGSITEAETERLAVPRRLESLRFLEEAGGTALAAIAFEAPDEPVGTELPPELYAVTGESLWGTFGALAGGEEALRQHAAASRAVATAPAAQRAAATEREVQRLRALAAEELLIGAALTLGSYDAARGGFPVVRPPEFHPIAHDQDLTGVEPPQIATDDPEGYSFLPATAEEAATVRGLLQGNRLDALVRVRPTGARRHSELLVSRPAEVLTGPAAPGGGRIARVALRLDVEAKPELGARGDVPVTPPDRLYLDHEVADLLAIAARPDAYGEPAFERMLVERLALERYHAGFDRSPPWGRFFENAELPLTDAERASLLEPFVAWTRARAAALPEELLLGIGANGQPHPVTGCHDVVEVPPEQSGIAVTDRYAELLGDEATALAADFRTSVAGSEPLPGPDRVFAVVGRPAHQTRLRNYLPCQWMNPGARDDLAAAAAAIGTDAAAYADTIVVVRAMPSPGAVEGRVRAVDYRLALTDRRLETPEPAPRDLPGHKGVIVLDADVTGIDVWTGENWREAPELTVTIEPEAWQGAGGRAPEALDILGLTLDIDGDAFRAAALERMPEAAEFTSIPAVEPTLFGSAVAYVDPATSEVLAAVTQPAEDGETVIAIMRSRTFGPGEATIPALRAALEGKYGPPGRGSADGRELFWGVPAQELDPWDTCGGHRMFRGRSAPQMQTDDADKFQVGTGFVQPGSWQQYGWPSAEQPPAGTYQGNPQCGPVVAARILDIGSGRLMLTVWLFDRARAEAAAAAKPDEPTKLQIEL